jgi:hypothetical protein
MICNSRSDAHYCHVASLTRDADVLAPHGRHRAFEPGSPAAYSRGVAGCLALTIVGGGAEIVGFGLAFYEMALTQQREFPDYRPLHHRALTWVRRKLGRSKSGTAHISGTGRATSSGHADLTVTRAPATTLQGRVERLEQEMQDLQRKQREDQAGLDRRIIEMHKRIGEAEAALQKQINELEAQRKQNLRDSLTFEKWGIVLFVIGVVLSVLGNAITC